MVLVESAAQQSKAGQTAQALSTLHQAIEASPGFADAHFQLGRLIRDSGGNADDAIASFRRVLRLDPAYELAIGLQHHLDIGGKKKTVGFPKRDQFAPELIYFSDCIIHDRAPEPSG